MERIHFLTLRILPSTEQHVESNAMLCSLCRSRGARTVRARTDSTAKWAWDLALKMGLMLR